MTEDNNIKSIIEKREKLRRELSYLYLSEEKDSNKYKIKEKQILKNEKEITDIENILAQSSLLVKEELNLNNIDYKLISKSLKEDEIYINYASIDEYYYIFKCLMRIKEQKSYNRKYEIYRRIR